MEQYLRFQTSVFGNFKDIDLSQESMSKLYQIYLKENMMPTIMKEFDVLSQNIKNRPTFIANDNSISISIASNRIDIRTDVSAGSNMFDKVGFIEVCIKYLKEFVEIFDVNFSRMSYIEDAVIKFLDDPMDCETRNQYINAEYVYNSENVFEWSSNSVSLETWDVNNKKEPVNLNVTTALRKLNAVKEGRMDLLNVVILTQDLNTLAENAVPRLNVEDVESFLKDAIEKSEKIRLIVEG